MISIKMRSIMSKLIRLIKTCVEIITKLIQLLTEPRKCRQSYEMEVLSFFIICGTSVTKSAKHCGFFFRCFTLAGNILNRCYFFEMPNRLSFNFTNSENCLLVGWLQRWNWTNLVGVKWNNVSKCDAKLNGIFFWHYTCIQYHYRLFEVNGPSYHSSPLYSVFAALFDMRLNQRCKYRIRI